MDGDADGDIVENGTFYRTREHLAGWTHGCVGNDVSAIHTALATVL